MQLYDTQRQQQIHSRSSPPKDTSKVYFFIFAIVALLATNIYFYIKYKNSDERVSVLRDAKVRVSAGIDRVEATLDFVSNSGVQLSEKLKLEEDNARAMIMSLRAKLADKSINQRDVDQAWQELKNLQLLVSGHIADINMLKQQNSRMAAERDSLLSDVKEGQSMVKKLEGQKSALQHMVKIASALKVSAFSVTSVHVGKNGNEHIENRARRADHFNVSFTIAENQVAKKDDYDVYMRVIDPNGNLIIDENNLFQVGGEDMQYTMKTHINFSNDGKLYVVPWKPGAGIQRGTYTFVLYSNGFLMGRTSITLK